MTTNILFLCPHAAAKSVLAMAECSRLAQTAQLDIHVSNAGTEPDPALNPKVDAYLRERGVVLDEFVPPLLTEAMLAQADHVVSIGCISAETVPPNTNYHDWSDVPMLSDDFEASVQRINEHAAAFIQSLR